jgi:hypothetical protein
MGTANGDRRYQLSHVAALPSGADIYKSLAISHVGSSLRPSQGGRGALTMTLPRRGCRVALL